MARPKAKAPTLRYHISGQSVVTIDGRDFYLGKHDSPESLVRHAVLIGIYQANQLKLPDGFDVRCLDAATVLVANPLQAVPQQQDAEPILLRHVTAAFRIEAERKYASQKAERIRCCQICDELDKHDGNCLAAEYGPKRLAAQRQRWVDSGKARVYCNRLTNIVRRIFKFAMSQELIEETVHRRLQSIEALRPGQTTAHETDPIMPVEIEHVRETARQLSPIIKAMIRVQVATGMRPSELCNIRPCDIDRSGPVWMYRPPKHKNKSKGKARAVPIIGDAREAIMDYLNRPATSYCFSPSESDSWNRAKLSASRTGSGSRKKLQSLPRCKPGENYSASSYRRAITRAAERAKVPHWFPYQLRHLTLTDVRNSLNGEAAQALAGHSRMQMTEHYAKLSESKAIEAAQAAPQLGRIE